MFGKMEWGRRTSVWSGTSNALKDSSGTLAMHTNAVFEALAHPARRRILRLLRRGPMTAGEIAGNFTLAKPTLSAHFNKLRAAGLVSSDRQGTSLIYRLNITMLDDAVATLVALKDTDHDA